MFVVAAGAAHAVCPGLDELLVDDFDEIQQDTGIEVLRQLEDYVQETEGRFVHFIVFGRPESFWPWLNHSDRTPSARVTATPIK